MVALFVLLSLFYNSILCKLLQLLSLSLSIPEGTLASVCFLRWLTLSTFRYHIDEFSGQIMGSKFAVFPCCECYTVSYHNVIH